MSTEVRFFNGKIKYVKDKGENIFFPITHEEAVIDEDGNTLDKKLQNKQEKLISGENVKTINGQSILGAGNLSVKGGDISDKTVTEINEECTDEEYPTAKSVYTYVEGLSEIVGDIDSVINHINTD